MFPRWTILSEVRLSKKNVTALRFIFLDRSRFLKKIIYSLMENKHTHNDIHKCTLKTTPKTHAYITNIYEQHMFIFSISHYPSQTNRIIMERKRSNNFKIKYKENKKRLTKIYSKSNLFFNYPIVFQNCAHWNCNLV